MATNVTTLSDPDKLGVLIRCRQRIDELNRAELLSFVNSVVSTMPSPRLKKVLFVGLNAIKEEMDYSEFQQINASVNEIIKKKNKKNKDKESKKESPKILKIPKNASMSAVIPSDILANNVCSFLMMRDITNLARCDRKFAIICHSPIAITNLMHRHDPYPYGPTSDDIFIDGHFYWKSLNFQRMKNVTKMSICTKNAGPNFFSHWCPKIQDLSLIGYSEEGDLCTVPSLSIMQRLSFVGLWAYPPLKLTHLIEAASCLNTLSFVNCAFYELETDYDPNDPADAHGFDPYNKLIEFIVPSQPNNLQTLKFINSEILKVDFPICNKANEAIENIETVKTSLFNLKAIIFDGRENESNLFYLLARNIVSNSLSFPELKSIHIHSDNISFFLNAIGAQHGVKELCVSSFKMSDHAMNIFVAAILTKLEKFCIVIDVKKDDISNIAYFERILMDTFKQGYALKLFQIVFKFESNGDKSDDQDYCFKALQSFDKYLQKLVYAVINYRDSVKQKELLFKIHIRSCHQERDTRCRFLNDYREPWKENLVSSVSAAVSNLVTNYLITYPLGKIQLKWTYNAEWHFALAAGLEKSLNGMDRIFRFVVNQKGSVDYTEENDYVHDEIDRHRVYAISASSKDLANHNVHHQNKWIADCKWCCNTPWV